MAHEFDFDYFVIGAGSGGTRSARIAASLGAKVGIAEDTHFGGTCVNVGCIPKKLYAYAADYGTAIAEAGTYGWTASAAFNWPKLKAAKDREISRLSTIYREILTINKVDIFEGRARFEDSHTLRIGDRAVTAEKFLIAVGGKPQKPPIKGAEFALTSDDIFALETVPENVTILGAGYIGLEFAHILHGIGCHVTIVHRGDHLLRGFDIDVQDHLLDDMKKQGVDFIMGRNVVEIGRDFVLLDDGTKHATGLVLAATGRVPNTNGLGLDKAGVTLDKKGYVVVDDGMKTSQDHIFAVGDVIDTAHLTPVAIAQGHALADRLFHSKPRETNFDLIATAVFSKPEIGTVGLTEQQAAKRNLAVHVYKSTFKPLRHTVTGKDSRVMFKMITDQATDRVLGLHIVGPDAAEMIQLAAVALNAGATKAHFNSTLPVHPTSAEELVFLHAPAACHAPEKLAERG